MSIFSISILLLSLPSKTSTNVRWLYLQFHGLLWLEQTILIITHCIQMLKLQSRLRAIYLPIDSSGIYKGTHDPIKANTTRFFLRYLVIDLHVFILFVRTQLPSAALPSSDVQEPSSRHHKRMSEGDAFPGVYVSFTINTGSI